ncbi:MAG TPA: hypothetical protein VFE32_10150 [Puia sp.]|jgi:hypothetical protein|nr:hypothetical protein [Puia sp.]
MNVVSLTKPIVALIFSALIGGGNKTASTAEVTYIPVTDDQGVFHVVYDNANGSRFLLQILDREGNQLYQHVFADKKFTRDFQLVDADSYLKVKFVIRNLGEKTSQCFEVETNSHVVEDVNVREVK